MDIKRSNITRPQGQTTTLATTQATPPPAVTAVDAVVDAKGVAIDGVDAVVQSSTDLLRWRTNTNSAKLP